MVPLFRCLLAAVEAVDPAVLVGDEHGGGDVVEEQIQEVVRLVQVFKIREHGAPRLLSPRRMFAPARVYTGKHVLLESEEHHDLSRQGVELVLEELHA